MSASLLLIAITIRFIFGSLVVCHKAINLFGVNYSFRTYERLIDAQQRADKEEMEAAGRALENRVLSCARDISEKYLAPPKTTDFGILFLPTMAQAIWATLHELRMAGVRPQDYAAEQAADMIVSSHHSSSLC